MFHAQKLSAMCKYQSLQAPSESRGVSPETFLTYRVALKWGRRRIRNETSASRGTLSCADTISDGHVPIVRRYCFNRPASKIQRCPIASLCSRFTYTWRTVPNRGATFLARGMSHAQKLSATGKYQSLESPSVSRGAYPRKLPSAITLRLIGGWCQIRKATSSARGMLSCAETISDGDVPIARRYCFDRAASIYLPFFHFWGMGSFAALPFLYLFTP